MDARFLAAAKRNDVLARWGITLGGVSIIASMLVMILFMIKVTLPLFGDPKSHLKGVVPTQTAKADIMAFGAGPYLERGFTISRSGELRYFFLADGQETDVIELEKPGEAATEITSVNALTKEAYNLVWNDGSVSALSLHFKPKFDSDGVRSIHLERHMDTVMPAAENAHPNLPGYTLKVDDETLWRARILNDDSFWIARVTREEDFMGDITETEEEGTIKPTFKGKITAYAVHRGGSRLFAATDSGELAVWSISNATEPTLIDQVQVGQNAISTIRLLFGDESIIVGDTEGNMVSYTVTGGDSVALAKTHTFKSHKSQVAHLEPSYKDKSFFSLDANGVLFMSHLTSERHLLTMDKSLSKFAVAERGDGVLALDTDGQLWLWELEVPHPDISAKTLWGKVHYEGYPEATWAWQSSSASDDFEPKTSLVPLLWGSLKGTFYGMLFSFPLALFAAIYTSYMMSPRWRSIVKPVVELMAAIPSVVTGFLAALWLAPRLEANLTGLVMTLVFLPLVAGSGLYFVFRRGYKINGSEWLWSVPFLLIGAWLAWQSGYLIQDSFFDGNLNLWFFQTLGLSVDQRNCVVIGFALGFAVIPIIFTISEDALSNVPKHLSAAALALGSSRWQAMRRVILPMASPGIFAATMIGFGRAVGETMIVLMATGNTPIMSPSVLNGMRTLSANIAVEIPEAPIDSSLYRVLFLSAVLLFSMTFIVNTVAEVVRVRLNQKYKNL